MKKAFLIVALFCSMDAFSAAPTTSCPIGYVEIVEDNMVIADSSCPTGYVSAGTATSCLLSTPDGSCIMFAPQNAVYTDSIGSYVYTFACPLE